MSFFSGVKNIVVSTAESLNNGVEVLEGLTAEMKRSSEVFASKSRVSGYEKEIELLLSNFSDSLEVDRKRVELLKAYQEVIKNTVGEEKARYVEKKKKLDDEMVIAKIRETEEKICSKEEKRDRTNFCLPIDEIIHLEQIVVDLNFLLKLTASGQHESTKKIALEKMCDIENIISGLQEERLEKKYSYFSSGQLQSRRSLYDGKAHGLTEVWYESGGKKKEVSYAQGDLNGVSRYWRNDGTILCEISVESIEELLIQRVYARNGQKITEALIKKGDGNIQVWLWNGEFVVKVKIKNRKVEKLMAIVKLMFKKNLWLAVFRARKKGRHQNELNDMMASIEAADGFMSEISKVKNNKGVNV